jgi:2-dehydro-3-deoxyphosphogluconate aldolase/(4S)-4-hydroxy-2-oxoglutarate aldolase
MHEVLERVGRMRLVPMVVMDDAAHADGFGDALVAGGLPVAEITFRTDAAEESIRRLAKRGDLLVGAGTVLTPQQADRAIDAGAAFLVAPGTNPRVIDHCLLRSVPIVPGVATPTDIELAMSFGLDTVKFFPAENLGGTATLKALAGPYADVMFLPTGGITPELLPSYLQLPFVLACGGSWLAPREALAKGDFATIRARVEEAAKLLSNVPKY